MLVKYIKPNHRIPRMHQIHGLFPIFMYLYEKLRRNVQKESQLAPAFCVRPQHLGGVDHITPHLHIASDHDDLSGRTRVSV